MKNDSQNFMSDPELEDVSKPSKRDAIKLAATPSDLLSKEGFAQYVGKTPNAVVCMAKAGKLPAFYMVDPLKPGGNAELWVNRKEWDKYAAQLVESAPAEWHSWKDRLPSRHAARYPLPQVPHLRCQRALSKLLFLAAVEVEAAAVPLGRVAMKEVRAVEVAAAQVRLCSTLLSV